MIEPAYCNLGEVGGNYSVFVPKKKDESLDAVKLLIK
jgi:hypothetical protein